MSNHISDNNGNLFDRATNNFVGIIDQWGNEQLIPTVVSNPVTGWAETLIMSGEEYPLPTVSIKKYLSGDNLCAALRDAIADQVTLASTNEGRCNAISIPSGDYTFDGTTVEIPPFIRITFDGNSVLRANDATVPVFWVRNDLAGYAFSRESICRRRCAARGRW